MIIAQCVKTNGKQMREPMSLNDWIMGATLINEGNVLNIYFFRNLLYIFVSLIFHVFSTTNLKK